MTTEMHLYASACNKWHLPLHCFHPEDQLLLQLLPLERSSSALLELHLISILPLVHAQTRALLTGGTLACISSVVISRAKAPHHRRVVRRQLGIHCLQEASSVLSAEHKLEHRNGTLPRIVISKRSSSLKASSCKKTARNPLPVRGAQISRLLESSETQTKLPGFILNNCSLPSLPQEMPINGNKQLPNCQITKLQSNQWQQYPLG